MRSLFVIVETYIIAALVNYFDSHSDYTKLVHIIICITVIGIIVIIGN